MKRTFLLLIIFFTINISAQDKAVQALIDEAIAVSPSLKMLKMKQRAASNRVEQESNLADPMLMLGVMNLPAGTYSFTEDAMTAKTIGITQEFPFPGKLSTKAEVEKSDINIVKNEILDEENAIRRSVIKNYNELRYLRKNIQLTEEGISLLKSISDVVRAKYSVSTASQQELFKLELEISMLSSELLEMKGEEELKLSNLNSLLLRERTSDIKTADMPVINFVEIDAIQLYNTALEQRPILKSVRQLKQKEELKKSLSEYDYYPKFSFSFQFGYREDVPNEHALFTDHLVSYSLGISLPLNYGGKISSKVEENETMQILYDEQLQMQLQKIRSEIGAATAKLNSLKSRIKLISDHSILQAEEILKTSLITYQVGKIEFIYLIDAQKTLLKLQSDLIKLKTEYLNELADLEFVTGKHLINEFVKEN